MLCLNQIAERERAITAFSPLTTWALNIRLNVGETDFDARLCNTRGAAFVFKSRDQANKLVQLLADSALWLDNTGVRTVERRTPAPYTISSLIPDAGAGLGFSASRTLKVTQTLYEAGWITHPTAEAIPMASDAIRAMRARILRDYGSDYLSQKSSDPTTPTHAAGISPVDVSHLPDNRPGDGAALYALIWRRFAASQMVSPQYRQSAARIRAADTSFDKPLPAELRTQGQMLVFDGWLRVQPDIVEPDSGSFLPQLTKGCSLKLIEARIEERTTEAPLRYSPTELIASLAASSVSHTAVYFRAIDKLTNSGCVQIDGGRIGLTEHGLKLANFFAAHFAEVLSVDAAVKMDEELDRITVGELDRLAVLRKFWARFSFTLGMAAQAVLDDVDGVARFHHEYRPIVFRPLAEG